MEQQKKDITKQEDSLKELLQEACSIAMLLEESLKMTKEEQSILYTVKTLYRLLKEMQGQLDQLPEGGQEVL